MSTRSDRRRLAQQALTERAAVLGREYELGEQVLSLRRNRPSAQRHWGCMAIIFGVLIGVPAAVVAVHGGPPGIIAVAAVLLIGGFALYRTARPDRTDFVFGYTGGVVQQVATEPAPRVIPWALLDTVRHGFTEPEDGYPFLSAVTVTSLDGTEITVGTGYDSTAAARFGTSADGVVAATRLESAIDQCAAGLPVEFGPLAVSRDAISCEHGRQAVAWPDIRLVELKPWEIVISAGRWRAPRRISLEQVPDAIVARLLIQDLAVRYQVKLTGQLVTRPPGPPTDEAVVAARIRLLTEGDVSEILGQPVTQSAASMAAMRFFRADGIHLSVVDLGNGRIAGFNRAVGERVGREVTGAGDRAWLVNADRTIIVTSGAATAKLTMSGLPPERRAGVMIPLGAVVGERLAAERPR